MGKTASSASSSRPKSHQRLRVGGKQHRPVTTIACTECQKKHTKCDGQSPCGRCRDQEDAECKYEAPVRQSKGQLRSEMDQLCRQKRSNDRLFTALARPGLGEQILQRLRNGETAGDISKTLAAMDHGSGSEIDSWKEHQDQEQDHETVLATTWTDVSEDRNLVQHLLALYFCWEYPTFASFSKEHFLQDLQDGTPRFCSPLLVNALLALGCRFTREPTHGETPELGDDFFDECQRLLRLEDDHHKLTTVQALGIMAIREASCGRSSNSSHYSGQSMRLAIEMGLHQEQAELDDDELAVRAATFWGSFALDHAWSLTAGSLPQCSYFLPLPAEPEIIHDIEASLWAPYTDSGPSPEPEYKQPSNVRSVFRCFCELSRLVHQSLYMLHSPDRPITSKRLLDIYTRYLTWYDTIPEVLRLGHNFTPAVLFIHMYYHFAILLLFRPLIMLRIIASNVMPRDVCCQAADTIQRLLRSYSQLYTLKRTPSFVPYFIFTSSVMRLAVSAVSVNNSEGAGVGGNTPGPGDTATIASAAAKRDPKVAEMVNQGIRDLIEMAPFHGFAGQALRILRFLAREGRFDVDVGGNSLNFFTPEENVSHSCDNGSSTAVSGGRTTTEQRPTASELALPGHPSLLVWDPHFCPYPVPGRPILPVRVRGNLNEAGFELL